MDHERCVALHDYLIHYAWLAEGHTAASLPSNNTFFTTSGAAAEAIRPRLHPSLAAFLDRALVAPGPTVVYFFFWASELGDPDGLFVNDTADLFDEPVDSLLCLYTPIIGGTGSAGGGVYYHQGYHRAAVFLNMNDFDFALPVKDHLDLWHPLETVLSNWIELVHLGKIIASPRDEKPRFVGEKMGPWDWMPYSEAQVMTCIGAWDRLCNAIEARMSPLPSTGTATSTAEAEPLLAPATLDAASVPDPCFARSFLTRARRPRFYYIAPGLMLPPRDASEFAAIQPFTRIPHDKQGIPPVCLFPSASREHEIDLTGLLCPWWDEFYATSVDPSVPPRGPAGVYSQSVVRSVADSSEEGFQLWLPYGLQGGEGFGDADDVGARRSDGWFVDRGSVNQLFQHGYKPFGGDGHRSQRLERLFDCWYGLVEKGVWLVGPYGVRGTIDTFEEADTERWRDYYIPPTW